MSAPGSFDLGNGFTMQPHFAAQGGGNPGDIQMQSQLGLGIKKQLTPSTSVYGNVYSNQTHDLSNNKHQVADGGFNVGIRKQF
ncbi:unnamed protein product [Didymodactylos carnosus]|uniref:Uncharacterized protein n=1 Tax=Didymodactylos carnosus TaxID=1234261 RepID=A0A814BS30_9BILA|nr:unnamed protein product [Didymodactylos carnosus]CAF3708463.1 unnamed protein product [Didymodactylos carnosus]